MPFMSSPDNMTNKSHVQEQTLFTPIFESIIGGLKSSASVMGPDHADKIRERLAHDPELIIVEAVVK